MQTDFIAYDVPPELNDLVKKIAVGLRSHTTINITNSSITNGIDINTTRTVLRFSTAPSFRPKSRQFVSVSVSIGTAREWESSLISLPYRIIEVQRDEFGRQNELLMPNRDTRMTERQTSSLRAMSENGGLWLD